MRARDKEKSQRDRGREKNEGKKWTNGYELKNWMLSEWSGVEVDINGERDPVVHQKAPYSIRLWCTPHNLIRSERNAMNKQTEWRAERTIEWTRVHTMCSDKRCMQMLCHAIELQWKISTDKSSGRILACQPFAAFDCFIFASRFPYLHYSIFLFSLPCCWCRFQRSRDSSGRYCKPTDLSNFQFNQKPCNFLDKIIFISSAAVRLSAAAKRCGGFFLSLSLPLCNWFYCFCTECAVNAVSENNLMFAIKLFTICIVSIF